MNKSLLSSALAIGALATVALADIKPADAANIGGYDFGVASDPGNFTPSATGVAPGLEFSDFSSNNVTIVNGVSGNPPAGGNRAISAQDWTDALDLSKYFTFTITPLPTTQSFSLSSLSFDARRGGNGPESIQIRSSNDGYATALGTFTNQVVNNDWTTLSINSLGLESLTQAITFRIYGYDAKNVSGNSSGLSLDNVFVHGDVTSVPTPALLPGLVGMGIAALRKRKQQEAEATVEA